MSTQNFIVLEVEESCFVKILRKINLKLDEFNLNTDNNTLPLYIKLSDRI